MLNGVVRKVSRILNKIFQIIVIKEIKILKSPYLNPRALYKFAGLFASFFPPEKRTVKTNTKTKIANPIFCQFSEKKVPDVQPKALPVLSKTNIATSAPTPNNPHMSPDFVGSINIPVRIKITSIIEIPIPNLVKTSEKNLGTNSNCKAINPTTNSIIPFTDLFSLNICILERISKIIAKINRKGNK